jgi:hypothetical protein
MRLFLARGGLKTYNPAVIRAVITQLRASIKHRSAWVGLAFALLAWPTCVLLSPLGATLANADATDLAKEVAFVSVLLVLAFEEVGREKYRWLDLRLSPAARAVNGLASRALLALCAGSLALLPAALLSSSIGAVDYLDLALSCAHLAALFLVLEALKLPPSFRSVLAVLLALAIPASIRGEAGAGLALSILLDPRCLIIKPANIWVVTAYQITAISIFLLLARHSTLPRTR